MAAHVGQAEVAPAVTVSESFVVEAQKMQYRGVKVVNVNWIFGDLDSVFIRGAIGDAGFDAASSQPRRECQRMMLRHFFQVSQTMPPEEGRRYLAWVKEKAFAPNFDMPKESQAL